MNSKQIKQRAKLVTALSLLALACVLAYTFWHTGALLARYIDPGLLGYVAAAGVELTVIAMSLQFNGLGDSGKSGFSKALFLFVFVATLTVSALANVSEGFRVSVGIEMTSVTFREIDPLVAIIGVSATGLLSLVTMSLAELLGDSFGVVAGLASDLTRTVSKDVSIAKTSLSPDTLELARVSRKHQAEQATDDLLTFYADNPTATQTQAGEAVARSRQWVSGQLTDLEAVGAIARNGQGVEVTQ